MNKVEFPNILSLSLSLWIVLLGLRARARPKHVAGGRKAGLVGIRREGLEERGGRPCWMLDCAAEGWGECVGMGSASWVHDGYVGGAWLR